MYAIYVCRSGIWGYFSQIPCFFFGFFRVFFFVFFGLLEVFYFFCFLFFKRFLRSVFGSAAIWIVHNRFCADCTFSTEFCARCPTAYLSYFFPKQTAFLYPYYLAKICLNNMNKYIAAHFEILHFIIVLGKIIKIPIYIIPILNIILRFLLLNFVQFFK